MPGPCTVTASSDPSALMHSSEATMPGSAIGSFSEPSARLRI